MPNTTMQGPTYLVGRWNGPEGQNLEVYEEDKYDDWEMMKLGNRSFCQGNSTQNNDVIIQYGTFKL
jgi:hypothetical protein